MVKALITLIAMHCNTSEFGLNNTALGVSEYTASNVTCPEDVLIIATEFILTHKQSVISHTAQELQLPPGMVRTLPVISLKLF